MKKPIRKSKESPKRFLGPQYEQWQTVRPQEIHDMIEKKKAAQAQ
jgi:hypothetical protein